MTLAVGDICIIKGLTIRADLNGKHCEILTPLEEKTVPDSDGVVRTAPRYGCEVITAPVSDEIGPTNGYFKPENLELVPKVTRRSVDLHLFGWTKE